MTLIKGVCMDLLTTIRTIPDFPRPGILFYDITTLMANADALREAVDGLTKKAAALRPQLLAGLESRGFLLAVPVALALGTGVLMVRKKGKLPGETLCEVYAKEYGEDAFEISADIIEPGQRVVVVDDLLATGGSLKAAVTLLQKAGAEVPGAVCLMELAFLKGREAVAVPVEVLVSVD